MHNEQPDNNVLRSENDRIRRENVAIREVLQNMICPSCGGPSMMEEERDLQKLCRENLELRQEFERVSNILANYMGRPIQGPAFDKPDANVEGQGSGSPAFRVDSLIANVNADEFRLAYPMETKTNIAGIATNAVRELIKLLRMGQPLWIKSPMDDRYVLDHDCYEKIIPNSTGLRFLRSGIESSKDTGVVNMGARLLVDLYLDADEWVHHFPTAVSRARTIHILEAGHSGTRSGSLQLIYEQMHILSPPIQPLEFYVLRYCQQIETGTWVIADVSCDLRDSCRVFRTSCWKHPSGCMIQDMPNGMSKVTCIEHVEVEDGFLAHSVVEDIVKSAFRLGAKRWIMTLQRMCERYFYMSDAGRPGCGLGGAGRRSMIMLAFRMIRSYCSILSFLSTTDLDHLTQQSTNSVQIALRKSTCPGQPIGIVVLAASSFWVPSSPQRVSEYLSDHKMRFQWDVLCYGNHVFELMRIPTGRHSANHISILQSLNTTENVIFQETMMEPSGSLTVYAPIHTSILSQLMLGMDSTTIPILASGFAVNTDGPGQKTRLTTTTGIPWSGGSFLTVGFQFLACSSLSIDDVAVDMIPTVHSFVRRTTRIIKSTFGC